MAADPSSQSPGEREQTFISHLIELRARLLRCILCVVVFFLVLGYFANDVYRLVAAPALEHLHGNNAMIATEVGSAFFAPLELAFYLSLYAAMPYILYQVWAFISPGLYDNERRFALPLLISSILLFYTGILFAFFIVLPMFFGFMATTVPEGVAIMTDIRHYLDFVLSMFLAFGLAFEVPVLTILLVWSGIISTAVLRRSRPYIIIAAFVIGAILTPPDVLSQILLSVPLWLLFELGLFMAARFEGRKDSEQAQSVLPP
jgi:sec-independent protein translocase protein TatC